MPRLFFAVTPPTELRETLAAEVAAMADKPRGRWLGAEQFHLTLAFLGECPDDSIPTLAVAADEAAAQSAPFEMSFGGLGAFDSLRRARVAFLRVEEGSEELADLAAAVHAALPGEYRPQGKRRFRAHLTVARFKEAPDPEELALVAQCLANAGPRRFRVEAIELVQSELHPTGARYSQRHRARLGAAG